MYAEMAQGIKHLLRGVRVPSTQKKSQTGMVATCNPSKRGERDVGPQSKLAS